MIVLKESPSLVLYLGRQGENGVRTLSFDFSDFVERFGDGILSLVMKRKASEDPFPVALDVNSQNIAVWTVSNVETDIAGTGEAQFIYTVDGNVKKTVIYKTKVDVSLAPVSETTPEAFQNWLDELAKIGGQITKNKNIALNEIENAESDAIDNVENAKSDAIDEINAEKENVMQEINELVDDARNYSQSASSASDTAGSFAEDAERYAQQAQSYAENLHFTDDGTGNISIVIGG